MLNSVSSLRVWPGGKFQQHSNIDCLIGFPIILTTWHLAFATFMTQVLARTTTLLDGRKTVKMTGRVYLRAIVPIGLFFSLSLICGNVTYLYLSVAFIQMLKVRQFIRIIVEGVADLTKLGHHSRRCLVRYLGYGNGSGQPEGPDERRPHCSWCCHRLVR